jgi:hypothetical protein
VLDTGARADADTGADDRERGGSAALKTDGDYQDGDGVACFHWDPSRSSDATTRYGISDAIEGKSDR